MITEPQIRERIKGAKNSTVFSEAEIAFMCRKKESEWQDKELAIKVRHLIYPFTKPK